MTFLLALLAVLLGIALSAYAVLYLPAWTAPSIALGAMILVSIGGGVLLAKALVLCAIVLMAARFMRHRER